MLRKQSVNIRQMSKNRAEQVGYYRFLENDKVTVSELIQSLSEHCEQQVEGLHVLAVNDTSEINLEAHRGRLKAEGQGVVGNNRDIGFFLHPTLVLNGENGFPLGISSVQLWNREQSRPSKKERNYQNLPIEEKESNKWLVSAAKSQNYLNAGGAKMVTHIGDRESDLYEAWARIGDGRREHLLVRSSQDRRLLGQEKSLYKYLEEQPCEGTYTVQLLAEPRRGQTAREALLAVRVARVEIQRPDNLNSQDYAPSIFLYAVEAKEVNPPPGQEPIHWRLLTTHEVVCLEQALKVIQWYCWRWRIEQLFATLKLAGLNLEASQLESIEAIQRLTILALSVAVRVLQMVEGRDNPAIPASVAFSDEQQQCLLQMSYSLQGRTSKQQNPFPCFSLPWATWLIARLGGWSGYRSQRPPGMPTLIHGLRQFESILLGWKLAQTLLVCTQ